MGTLKLNDLLNISKEDLMRTKVRLNTRNNEGTNPIDVFKKDPNKLLEWNYWNNCTYVPDKISIGLINMGNDRWLFFTIGKVTEVDVTKVKNTCVACKYQTLTQYEHLFGRVVVYYHNKTQQMFRNANTIMDELEVEQILPTRYTGFDFPGYDNVCLSYDELKTIINGYYPSYRNALQNQKAVYVQTDKSNGKVYIGSATSNNGLLLDRWTSYVINGHGGNIGLMELIKEKGFGYIQQNFQYTIIENFNKNVDDNYVLQRESYWKNVLKSKEFGYNKN